MLKLSKWSGGVISSVAFTGWCRPLPIPNNKLEKSKYERMGWISRYKITDHANHPLPILYDFARNLTIAFQVSLSRLLLMNLGKFQVISDSKYNEFIHLLLTKDTLTPVITVSNHRSIIDDPGVFACLLPYWMNVQPKFLRYTLCAQEYCFNEEQRSLLSAYMGLGKVLPIKRGEGIHQTLLLDFARVIAAGNWCHIFPEGGVYRLNRLGGRSNGKENKIGKLKWGVGKLIAHSPKIPTVVPLFITGTEDILPVNPITEKIDQFIPQLGYQVTVRFGSSIYYQDLIEEYESKYGKLWKYHASIEEESLEDRMAWESSRYGENTALLQLYSEITKRIEIALTVMNDEENCRRFKKV